MPRLNLAVGDTLEWRDEYGTIKTFIIEDFRETEIVARTCDNSEWRLDPRDFSKGKIKKLDMKYSIHEDLGPSREHNFTPWIICNICGAVKPKDGWKTFCLGAPRLSLRENEN